VRRVSIIAYADLGSQTGQALTHTGKQFRERGRLETIYCRGVETPELRSEYVKTPIPFGRILPRALTGIHRFVTDRFDHRVYSEALFDRFTARYLQNDGSNVHFHYTPGYHRSLVEGLNSEVTTVVRGSTELVQQTIERKEEEIKKFNLDVSIPHSARKKARLRRQTLEDADRIVDISTFVKRSLVEAGIPPERIGVAPLGIDADTYPDESVGRGDTFRVTYVGSIQLLKGIQYLLQAWHRIGWDKDINTSLQLCGLVNSEIQPILEKYASSNVSLPGYVEPRPYYCRASVFVFPSITDGFGKSVLEAMSCGLPVVITENSGVADVITDGKDGFIVPPYDPGAIGDRLHYLRNNPGERRQMGKMALKTAQEQTWGRHVDATLKTIDRSE